MSRKFVAALVQGVVNPGQSKSYIQPFNLYKNRLPG
jgi:hypothetical protein